MREGTQPSHLPVMFGQALDGLRVLRDGRYLDGTFGRGGHARGVLDRLGPDGRLLVMDKDPEAIATAHALFGADGRVAVYRGSFADLASWRANFQQPPQQLVLRIVRGNARGQLVMR